MMTTSLNFKQKVSMSSRGQIQTCFIWTKDSIFLEPVLGNIGAFLVCAQVHAVPRECFSYSTSSTFYHRCFHVC